MDAPSASELLENVYGAYASLRSYRDRGEVVSEQLRADDASSSLATFNFATHFEAPERFQLDYQGDIVRHVVWDDGSGPQSWASWDTAAERHESFSLPLAGRHGVTNGVSTLVPSLLGLDGRRAMHISDPVLVGEALVEGERCWELSGAQGRSTITVWVAQASYLVRRHAMRTYFSRSLLDDFAEQMRGSDKFPEIFELLKQTEEYASVDTITLWPEVDMPLAVESFAFDPPVPETQRTFERVAYEGIGARLEHGEQGIAIHALFPGKPAELAGVRLGDIILAVDGVATTGWSVDQTVERIRGPAGTTVTLTIDRAGDQQVIEIKRARFTP